MNRSKYYIGNVLVGAEDTDANANKYIVAVESEATEYKIPNTIPNFQNVILGETIEESCQEASDEYYDN